MGQTGAGTSCRDEDVIFDKMKGNIQAVIREHGNGLVTCAQ